MKFSKTVAINSTPAKIWAALTETSQMIKWLGDPEMQLEVHTTWEIGTAIRILGFHHVKFENKGVVLAYEPERRLSYSHLSSVSRLPDTPENYTILEFLLRPTERHTEVTLNIENFQTDLIRKHLEFYWRTTLETVKKYVEKN